MLKPGRLLSRCPSPSMVVACLALFVALSGGAYAAVAIPAASVGSRQLKAGAVGFRNLAPGSVGTRDLASNAVTYAKIAPGQIGHARVAQSQIQWRVTGKCATASAIASVSDTGAVTCTAALPDDYSTPGLTEPVTSSTNATVLASESLPAGGAYQVSATPYLQVNGGTSGDQNVEVTCELAAGTTTATRSATLALDVDHEQQAASIPLSVDLSSQPSTATEAAVACTSAFSAATAPTVQVSSGIDALQVAVFKSTPTPGTSTTLFTLTTPTPGTAPTTTGTATTATGTATATTTTSSTATSG